MFEDSLVESTGRIRTRSSRYAAGSFVLETALVAVLLLIPYLYPDALPRKFLSVPLIAPPPAAAAPIAAQPSTAASRPQPVAIDMTVPTRIPHGAIQINDPAPGPIAFTGPGSATGAPGALPILPATPPPMPRVHPAKPTGPLHVSSGVAAGQLVVPIEPHYPAIALATHTQGTVVVTALISATGRIESLRVVSGPPLLVNAATEAIRRARYRPWTLNGEPVEVETTINVVFSLGNNRALQ
ncbi:MAG TPA: TonB family protein [Acidobacteriaceae bacterium]|jgi:protein TonB|nr:TonB family protein [Acidobacteriaceae bacterium]